MFVEKRFESNCQKILRDFWEEHEDCEQLLKAWFHKAQKAE